MSQTPQAPLIEVGMRIRLRAYVERFDAFIADPGLTGIISEVERDTENRVDSIVAEMERALYVKDPDVPESNTQIVWNEGHCYGVPSTIPLTGEVYERTISVLELFLTEVEILP